jgi:hypothetical protein
MPDFDELEARAAEDARIDDAADCDRMSIPTIQHWVERALGPRSRPTQIEQNENYRRDMAAIGDGRKLS